MFPRVLGYLAGRAAALAVQVYQRLTGQEADSKASKSIDRNLDRYVPAALAFAASTALPTPLRVPAVLALTMPSVLNWIQGQADARETEPAADPSRRGLACYLRAASESDPFLFSPVGTLPLERCLRP